MHRRNRRICRAAIRAAPSKEIAAPRSSARLLPPRAWRTSRCDDFRAERRRESPRRSSFETRFRDVRARQPSGREASACELRSAGFDDGPFLVMYAQMRRFVSGPIRACLYLGVFRGYQ